MAESRVLAGVFSEYEDGAENSQPCDTRTSGSFHCSWLLIGSHVGHLLPFD